MATLFNRRRHIELEVRSIAADFDPGPLPVLGKNGGSRDNFEFALIEQEYAVLPRY